jgi:hypothetical protein
MTEQEEGGAFDADEHVVCCCSEADDLRATPHVGPRNHGGNSIGHTSGGTGVDDEDVKTWIVLLSQRCEALLQPGTRIISDDDGDDRWFVLLRHEKDNATPLKVLATVSRNCYSSEQKEDGSPATESLAPLEPSTRPGLGLVELVPIKKKREDMPDIKDEVNKTAAEITKVAQDAAYMAIGLGVIGLQKAQVRRRELQDQFDSLQNQLGQMPAANVRKELAKAYKDLDKTFGQLIERMDATFDPVSERLPAGAQAVVQQAKEARDQLRGFLTSLAA